MREMPHPFREEPENATEEVSFSDPLLPGKNLILPRHEAEQLLRDYKRMYELEREVYELYWTRKVRPFNIPRGEIEKMLEEYEAITDELKEVNEILDTKKISSAKQIEAYNALLARRAELMATLEHGEAGKIHRIMLALRLGDPEPALEEMRKRKELKYADNPDPQLRERDIAISTQALKAEAELGLLHSRIDTAREKGGGDLNDEWV